MTEIETIARVCHEANRAWCVVLAALQGHDDDPSQVPWDKAPAWQKDSAMEGVSWNLRNPDAPPELSHESWMSSKLADGWTYGVQKDLALKTHPCLLPWAELPEEQRRKDMLFQAIVKALS